MPTLDAKSIMLSPHAIDRFGQRYPASISLTGPSRYQALLDLVDVAVYVGTTVGGELWQAPDASGQQVPFVVRRDPKAGCEVMVTVLPPHAAAPAPDDLDEIVAAYQRLMRGTVDAEGPVTLHRHTPCPPKAATTGGETRAPTTAAEDKANRAIALEWVRFAANEKKEAAAKINREIDRARGARNAANPTDGTLRGERDAAASHARRLRAALDHQDVEMRRAKSALKIALRALTAPSVSEEAAKALGLVRAIDPGLLTPAFLNDGEVIPKDERIRQSNEARTAHGYDPDAWKRVDGAEEASA